MSSDIETINQAQLSTLLTSPSYAFDVLERHGSHFLANRRLFAMADEGMFCLEHSALTFI